MKKYLLAVSGGPDSMALLFKYKAKNIVVATVNYNKRKDSWKDVKIVENFCKKYNIVLEILDLKEHEKFSNNFQEDARIVRYNFFKEIYAKYNCDELLIAHHNDDFIESALMQENSNRKTFFYGIKPKNIYMGMNIRRPFLYKWWKEDLKEFCLKNEIDYAVDYTNDLNIYTRNKIRNSLKTNALEEKIAILEDFRKKNKKLQAKYRKHLKNIEWWKSQNFSCDEKIIEKLFDFESLLYLLIHEMYSHINLTSGKIKSIADFVKSTNRTSEYKLDDENTLKKVKNKLVFS